MAAKKNRIIPTDTLWWLWVGIFLFYLLTLAPTVLWGDHAFFQRSAFEGTLRRDGGGHWMWLRLAEYFATLPLAGSSLGSVAYRVNLLSAVAATLTLIVLAQAMRALNLDRTSTGVACASLAVAHTFWMHAVRAEVYTVFTVMMALQLWLWLIWRPQKPWPLYLAAGLFGITLLGHQMAVLLLPSMLVLLYKRRHWLDFLDWTTLSGSALLGLAPFMLIVLWQTQSHQPLEALRLYFTHASLDWTHAMFAFSVPSLPRDAAMWLGLLGLQFVGPAGLLGLYGLAEENTLTSSPWLSLVTLYVTSVFFAFSYRVNDQFVFYLPSYLAFAFFIARGWQRLEARLAPARRSVRKGLWLLILILPVATYFILPRMLATLDINPLHIRTLPGREPNRYFLWPASHNLTGAETYAKTAFAVAEPESIIIADHTPMEALRYLQTVAGLRQDIQLIGIIPGMDLQPVLGPISSEKTIYLADNNPDYYNLGSLDNACLEQQGTIYRLSFGVTPDACP